MTAVPDLRWVLTRESVSHVPAGLRSPLRSLEVQRRARGVVFDDLVVAGFPKSGSTWLRFVLAEMFTGQPQSSFGDINLLSPDLGRHASAARIVDSTGRLIKSHELYRFHRRLPSRSICVVRDGRDVCLSLYHYLHRRGAESVDFDAYFRAFLSGKVLTYGSWEDHVLGWTSAARNDPGRVAVVRYEDLLLEGTSTLVTALEQIGFSFERAVVGTALANNTAEKMREKERNLTDRVLRESEASTPFVRAARSNQWVDEFSEQQKLDFEERFSRSLIALGYEFS